MQTLITIVLVSGALVMSQGVRNGAADEERAQGLPLSTAQDLTDTGRLADQTAATRTAQHRGPLSDGRGTMASHFDFPEMAKDSLGAAWARRTPTERAEFVQLFAAFLKKAVLSRIEPYSKTITDPADRGDESYAKVGSKGQGRGMPEVVWLARDEASTKVGCTLQTPRGGAIHINYLFYRRQREWKIYDLIIEDISLVRNYRAQFRHVISTSSYAALVQRIEQKLSEFEGEGALAG